MQITIQTEKITAVIDSLGAELSSVTGGGTEYLWQADPAVWKRHAPILFPFICNTASKKYTVNGKEYALSNHGFARDSEFEVLYEKENEAGFRLKADGESRKIFPYDFELYVKYAVSGNRLGVSYIVKNTGDKVLPYFIGGHPAFNVPDFGDYFVQYEKPEHITRGETVIADNTDKVDLSHELFADDVFMKDKPNSSWVALVSKSEGMKVRLNYDKSGCIAVWSSYFADGELTEKAKFVCLEPWSSTPVYCDGTEELTEMKNALRLNAGESGTFSYTVEIF
ncbi:MAG: aldose 1-epimerase family protein [Ruminococcus sp.]|nr:aldose 1-epimerase family protein [Ruminococcus sp.]MCM1382871.1 aldose 1-epimerase family protein [Muribaculaceae bacterium]MCM1479905.1 aldose 1-epimerase family protein [Muribaculaceae bacterium]